MRSEHQAGTAIRYVRGTLTANVGRAAAALRRLDAADGLSVLITGLALVLCLRSFGPHLNWLLLALLTPGLRLLLAPAYRLRVGGWLGRTWTELAEFAARGGPLPWRGTCIVAVLPVAGFYLSEDWFAGSLDSRAVVPSAVSLLRQGNLELSEFTTPARLRALCPSEPACWFEGLPYFFRRTPAGVYPFYPSGMVQFAVPSVGLARLAGARLHTMRAYVRLEKWTAAWLAAACVGLFFLIALHLAPPGAALAATLTLAFGSSMYSTLAQALWQHGGVVFWALVAILVEFRRQDRPTELGAVLQGAACGLMLSCRVTAVLILAPFGVWLLLRQPRRALLVVGVALVAFAPWANFGLRAYGSPVGHYGMALHPFWWADRIGHHWAEVLFSPGRGLVVYQPWLVLALGLLVPAVRRRLAAVGRTPGPAGWERFCLAAIAGQVVLIASWKMWGGGVCWGSRLLSEVVPLGALLCVRPLAWLWQHRAGRTAVLAAALLSAYLHVAGIHFRALHWNNMPDVRDRHQQQMKSWRNAPFLFLPLNEF